jgi:DNA-binding transcriptional MerR regulator
MARQVREASRGRVAAGEAIRRRVGPQPNERRTLPAPAPSTCSLDSALGAGLTIGVMAQVLMRTGEFARATSLSVKALRVYHDSGLLVPSVVDSETGYRAYSPAQLTDAAIIRILREVGVSLQDIHEVLEARDLGFVRKVLDEQAERFQVGLDAVARIVDDLYLDDEADPGGVVLRRETAHIVLVIQDAPLIADLGTFLRRSERTLQEAATTTRAVTAGCFGACYPPQLEEDRQDVTAFLPVSAPVLVPPDLLAGGVRIDELPACDLAVLELRGSYWGLEGCYRRLGAWVAFHAVPSGLPVRELYLTSVGEPDDEDAVTELQWPVTATDAS